jgi:hypothetical protein
LPCLTLAAANAPGTSLLQLQALGGASLIVNVKPASVNTGHPETLVIIERDNGIGIEVRELVRDGAKAFLIFARSDGTESRVEIDPSKLHAVAKGRIEVDFQYRGGVIKAPQQEV